MYSILVVDDELSIRESFSLILEGKYRILLAASGEAALKSIADQKVDMVYLDIRMPGLDGLETLKRIKEIDPDQEIIMITAVNDVQKASEAIKHGARDYVVKPFDVSHILKLTEQILRKKAILQEGIQAQKKAGRKMPELLGHSDKIDAISKTINEIKKDERVLILGETGTEKEVIAEIIHGQSDRAAFPYKALHLSQRMPLSEIKSLLFGQEKGASTVDLGAKAGLLEQTKGGTLFLNHLESLPQEVFNILASKEFSREGGATKIPVETRLIAGANPDFSEQNKELFKFFSEVLIQVPPLRERSSDIPALANHFIERYHEKYRKQVGFDPAVLEVLTSYSWPGNVSELEALIERLILSSSNGKITLEDLPIDILIKTAEGAGSGFISTFEREYIQRVFEQSGKNKEKTAALLGVNPILLETKL